MLCEAKAFIASKSLEKKEENRVYIYCHQLTMPLEFFQWINHKRLIILVTWGLKVHVYCLYSGQTATAYILCVCDEKKYCLFTYMPTQVVKSFQVWKLAQWCCCYVITWELLFFSIQTLFMHHYSASYVNKFLGGKTIRIIKCKQTFLYDCCAGFLCIV